MNILFHSGVSGQCSHTMHMINKHKHRLFISSTDKLVWLFPNWLFNEQLRGYKLPKGGTQSE